jgi:thiol-disulfide isomerase/thioredoxin
MNIIQVIRLLKNWQLPLLLALAVLSGTQSASALYQAGDVVTTNFSFIARQSFTRPDGTVVPAGARTYIRDFVGRVVFLEWFAVWCPYCQAAAPQVSNNIVSYYAARGGNPYGVPVLHIAVNQESSPAYTASTDNFVTAQRFNPVVNDYDANSINPVRYLFQTSGQPTFVILNCLTNSPSHLPWQVLVNEQKYGVTDFTTTLASYRAIIDTVQPAIIPPQLTAPVRNGTNFEFTFPTQTNRTYRVQASTNLINWTTLRTNNGTSGMILFRDTNAPMSRRFYRTVTP